MNLAVLAITDRPHYYEQAFVSLQENVPEPKWFIKIDDTDHELGFAGAIAEGWRRIREETEADWVFHAEDDFTYNVPVPVDRMIAVLARKPHLAQLSLLRQPVNAEERAAGGIIQGWTDDFTQVTDTGDVWTEHRRFWTTNPSVYSAAICAHGWPQEPESEGKFTHRLLADPELRFGIWGAKQDPPLVTHIGEARAGHGY